jgi:hypothetical protein
VGSSLARAAYAALLKASEEMNGQGSFGYAAGLPGLGAFNQMFR